MADEQFDLRKEFADMLLKIKLPSGLSSEEKDKLFKPMELLITANYPKSLFKYRPFSEQSLEDFNSDKIWISKPSQFNDPFDSQFYFNKDDITQWVDNECSEPYLREIYKYIKVNNAIPKGFVGNKEVMFENIEYLLSLDEKSRIAKLNQVRDEANKAVADSVKEANHFNANNMYVSCFSEQVKSPIMWAHYTDNHKGFVIEYDFSDYDIKLDSNVKNIRISKVAFPVVYSNGRYCAAENTPYFFLNHIGMDTKLKDTLAGFKALLHKSPDWSYEKEWRFIFSEINDSLQPIKGFHILKKPKAVYIGQKMSLINRKIMITLAKEKNIQIFEMEYDHYNPKYEMDIK